MESFHIYIGFPFCSFQMCALLASMIPSPWNSNISSVPSDAPLTAVNTFSLTQRCLKFVFKALIILILVIDVKSSSEFMQSKSKCFDKLKTRTNPRRLSIVFVKSFPWKHKTSHSQFRLADGVKYFTKENTKKKSERRTFAPRFNENFLTKRILNNFPISTENFFN